jgi:hypothetical protein
MGLESAFEPILLDESEAQLIRPRMRDARERNVAARFTSRLQQHRDRLCNLQAAWIFRGSVVAFEARVVSNVVISFSW